MPKEEMLVEREVLERCMPETCQAQTTRGPDLEEAAADIPENKTLENVTIDILYHEVKDLRRNIGEVFKRFAMEKTMASDES